MINIVSIKDLPKGSKRIDARGDIKEFLKSTGEACEIEIPDGRKVANVRATYIAAAKKLCAPVEFTTRDKRLFMLKA